MSDTLVACPADLEQLVRLAYPDVDTTFVLHIFGVAVPCYAALSSLALNIVVSAVLSFVFNFVSRATDSTVAEDYVS